MTETASWLVENELLHEIIATLDVGVFVTDHRGVAVVYNSAMATLEGLQPEQVLGRHILDVFPTLSEESSTVLQVLRTGYPIIDRHQTYLNLNGRKITTINTTIPIIKDGKLVGALETSRDITWLRELSDRVLDLQRALLAGSESTIKSAGLKRQGLGARYTFGEIIGLSNSIKDAINQARLAARTNSTVLLYGETGTGKELFAQSIHNASPRHDGPFIAQNCAAIPPSLLEGILFGTAKGSFTGAVDRPGLFEQASGGTLLLDELNTMGPELQAKLLRVLQEGAVRRVGALKDSPVDVRVIATTNLNPQQAVSMGAIRQDLYYRLSVVTIYIPPLRERDGDLELLTNSFISQFNREFSSQIEGIDQGLWERFQGYHWPGNVRELRHSIEGAFNMALGDTMLRLEHLPLHIRHNHHRYMAGNGKTTNSLPQAVAQYEADLIGEQILLHQGNITKAAEALGISRQALQYKLRKLEI